METMEEIEMVKVSKKGRTVTFEVSAWWSPEDDCIRLASNDSATMILTVRNDPKLKRGHPKLFRELAKMLWEAGAPAPDINPIALMDDEDRDESILQDIFVTDRDMEDWEKIKKEVRLVELL